MSTIKTGAHSKSAADRSPQDIMERRIADGLRLRRDHLGMSVADLAEKSGVSRAMISKVERLEASPTAALLGRLCAGLGITLSSLIASAESTAGPPISRAKDQPVWRDPDTGLLRTMVSPRNTGSKAEIVCVELPSGAAVTYEAMPEAHYDQHVYVLQGKLTLTFGTEEVEINPGDCVRSRFDVLHAFANRGRSTCKYLVFIAR